jgi:capsular polysaccharide biosynthesis protein
MSDYQIDGGMIGRLARRRWRVLLVLALVGGLSGFGAAALLSPGYASNSKVLLLGERPKDAVLGEVQIATSRTVLDRTADELGNGLTGRDLEPRISASVLDGNVLQIVGTGPTPEAAQRLTDVAAGEYIKFSSQIVNDTAAAVTEAAQRTSDDRQRRLDEANKRATDLAAAPAVNLPGPDGDRARSDLQQAQASAADLSQEIEAAARRDQQVDLTDSLTGANLRVIEPALTPIGPASPTVVQLVAGGALLLPLLGVFGQLIALRADPRVHRRSELAAILGAPVLADVTVPALRPTGRLAALRDDRRWVTAESPPVEDEAGRAVRYRRILTRLQVGDRPQRLLALLGPADPHARAALVDLARVSAADGRHVSVRTRNNDLADAVREAAAEAGTAGRLSTEEPGDASEAAADLLLTVEVLALARPAVPEGSPAEPVVLITTIGSGTPAQLNDVAGACVEAGRPLAGALLVVPSHERPRLAEKADTPTEAETSVVTVTSG